MFVLPPHPCVLVCVRVCVCVPAAWIVWIASDTTLAGSRPRKEVDFVVSSPSREYRNTTASTRDETLVCFCLSCTNKQTVKQKDPFFLFFTFFFCIVVSYTRILCTTVYRYLHQFIQFKIYSHARLRRSQKVPGIELCSVRPTGGPTFPGFAC